MNSSTSRRAAAGGVLAVTVLLGLGTTAHADVCDAYSGTCTTPGAGSGQGGGGGAASGTVSSPGTVADPGSASTTSNASTLPFTGADLVAMTVVGLGAVATGGVALRLGRRRT